MSLYSDLNEVLTPYATKIKGLTAANEELKADLGAKVNLPSNGYGTSGKVLRSTGTGAEWATVGQPTDAQTAEAVSDWLDKHPEATTTVQDGSLTYKKLEAGTLGYVTPEMFGAVGDGITDDTTAMQVCLNSSIEFVLLSGIYKITNTLLINHNISLHGGTLRMPSNDARMSLLNITNGQTQIERVNISNIKFESVRDNNHVFPPSGHTRAEGSLSSNITFIRCTNVDSVNVHDVSFTNSEYDMSFRLCGSVNVENFTSTNASMVCYAEQNDNICFENGTTTLYDLLGSGDHHFYICAGNKNTVIKNVTMISNAASSGAYPIHLYASNEQILELGVIESALIENCKIKADTLIVSMCTKECVVRNCVFEKITSESTLLYQKGVSIVFDSVQFISNVRLQISNTYDADIIFKNCTFDCRIGFGSNYNHNLYFYNCSMFSIYGNNDGSWNAFFYSCKIINTSGYAIYTSHTSASKLELYECEINADADGLFAVRSSGTLKLLKCYGTNANSSKKLNYNTNDYSPTIKMYMCCFPDLTVRSETGTVWETGGNVLAS